jgi:hypothetical protein
VRPIDAMSKHPKRPRDPAQLAKFVIDLATGETPASVEDEESPATKFARTGGLKGGKARAGALTEKRRKEIAKKASEARWSTRKPTD